MIDCPRGERLNGRLWVIGLARHRPAEAVTCPRCRGTARRLFRAHGPFPADRGRAWEGDYPLLTRTVCEPTRPRPSTLVLRRRGMAKGAPTARRARTLGRSRTPLHTLRQRRHATLHATAPIGGMTGTALEAEARSQNAGETTHPPAHPHGSATPTGESAPRARHVGQ
jgi:hypothetical protein